MSDIPESGAQHDQQDWMPVADYESEDEARAASAKLRDEGIPSMIDQREMSARFVLLVSALERDEARQALREVPAEETPD